MFQVQDTNTHTPHTFQACGSYRQRHRVCPDLGSPQQQKPTPAQRMQLVGVAGHRLHQRLCSARLYGGMNRYMLLQHGWGEKKHSTP